MKHNILQNIIGFIFKYIWIFCALLIVLELFSVCYTTGVLMQQTAQGVMESVTGDISSRVDGVLRLLTGMAADERYADVSKPLYDRVIQALPYQNSYNLYMIAMTDENVNVISADEKEPPKENFSLAYRDYMQRLYQTGEYQITDAFLSGDGKETMNYTIAVPIFSEGKVAGSVFGSIYFDDIEKILTAQSQNQGRRFYLLGTGNTIMAGEERALNSKTFLDLSKDSFFLDDNAEAVDEAIQSGASGDFWEWDEEGLTYVMYQRVEPTKWMILHRVQFLAVFEKLLPVLCGKICFYIFMCVAVFVLGKKYLNRNLSKVNHMLNRMAAMQKELFQSEYLDYDNLLELTEQGLTDQLTGLPTRAILLKRMKQLTEVAEFRGAVIFIDLDNLKTINDNFGHEGGDCALTTFGEILTEYERRYEGIAARYGGDEFVFMVKAEDEAAATQIAEELCRDFNRTVTTEKHSFTIHGSLGVSFYPTNGTELEELICKADLALYTAKQNGKNQCVFFSVES